MDNKNTFKKFPVKSKFRYFAKSAVKNGRGSYFYKLEQYSVWYQMTVWPFSREYFMGKNDRIMTFNFLYALAVVHLLRKWAKTLNKMAS